MVHHDHRVAIAHEVVDDAEQPLDVGRMQADGGLVEHVEHAGSTRAHGAGQLDALQLAVGKRRAGTVQAQIAEAELHRLVHLRDNRLGHRAHVLGQLVRKRRGPLCQLVECLGRGLRQVHAVQERRARLG